MSISKVIARAWADSAYKATLLKDPHTALTEAGVKIPSGTKVKAVEDTADTKHLVLPVAPPNAAELSDKELEKVSGGINCAGCVGPG